MSSLQFHEVTNIFPMMAGDEFKALVEDIKVNGLIEPIWTYQGKIIDGRNRFKACEAAGVNPKFNTWNGNGSLVSFVVSLNLKRRHLNESQKAMVALDILPMLEHEAKERQGTRTDLNLVAQKPQGSGKARDKAGEMLGIGGRIVSDAKMIQAKSPEKAEEVRQGRKTITQAAREIKQAEVVKKVSLPNAKYRVICADPPWGYGNTQPDYQTEQRDHYPVMKLVDICALPVANICEDNSVLFLWVTSPILEESFQVVKAWGFRYKASFVWDKIKHNMGHYNSVRHEFLLVCVRGSCQPDTPKLFDSVQSIERTEHSKKPKEFYEIIETLYPHGRRIELFARIKRAGWDVFGYEA